MNHGSPEFKILAEAKILKVIFPICRNLGGTELVDVVVGTCRLVRWARVGPCATIIKEVLRLLTLPSLWFFIKVNLNLFFLFKWLKVPISSLRNLFICMNASSGKKKIEKGLESLWLANPSLYLFWIDCVYVYAFYLKFVRDSAGTLVLLSRQAIIVLNWIFFPFNFVSAMILVLMYYFVGYLPWNNRCWHGRRY